MSVPFTVIEFDKTDQKIIVKNNSTPVGTISNTNGWCSLKKDPGKMEIDIVTNISNPIPTTEFYVKGISNKSSNGTYKLDMQFNAGTIMGDGTSTFGMSLIGSTDDRFGFMSKIAIDLEQSTLFIKMTENSGANVRTYEFSYKKP